ncbi:MAG: hypothetical protein ACAH89_07135, partial [Rariglobus sp.]
MRLSPLPLLLCLCALSHVSAQNLNSHDLAVAKRKFLVDRYGQSARKDYPGKVASDDELKADIEKQKSALGTYAGP